MSTLLPGLVEDNTFLQHSKSLLAKRSVMCANSYVNAMFELYSLCYLVDTGSATVFSNCSCLRDKIQCTYLAVQISPALILVIPSLKMIGKYASSKPKQKEEFVYPGGSGSGPVPPSPNSKPPVGMEFKKLINNIDLVQYCTRWFILAVRLAFLSIKCFFSGGIDRMNVSPLLQLNWLSHTKILCALTVRRHQPEVPRDGS